MAFKYWLFFCFFCEQVQYQGYDFNTTNIVLFSTNQITDILYVSNIFFMVQYIFLIQNVFVAARK